MTSIRLWLMAVVVVNLVSACQSDQDTLFHLLAPEDTGITFANQITEVDSLNVIDYTYIYNGSGVGVGDVNNDGWPDLFFAGNQVSSRLYLNRGETEAGPFQFEEITDQSGVGTDRWSTGVAMVDINGDSWLDIYVCVASKFDTAQSKNYFFINQGLNEQGIPTFVDQARQYGLDDAGYSTQAVFFDYDLDGDLDMYLLTNGMEDFNHNLVRPKKTDGEGVSNDRLYRNDTEDSQSPVFTEVTREAGIRTEGYGLGIGVADLNQDGYPDVYAANDFVTNDLLWVNNGDGTFTDRAGEYLKHQSQNGMGTDLADFNNDGLVDIVVLDMLPEDNFRQKIMLTKPNYDRFQLALTFNYTPQYVRNTLQVHNGFTPDGTPSFSEIGQMAGIYDTDWSWSALFADYDNDGYRDLLITNGYVKDVTDLDYITYQSSAAQFGTQETKREKSIELAKMLKEAKIHNYAFRNNGAAGSALTFSDQSEAWGIDRPSFTNGTAFADLDLDGDLDLVMNNINETAFVYENRLPHDDQHHYLRVRLAGPPANPLGYQSEITLHYGGQQQYHYQSPYRGYKSTVDPTVHFGLGSTSRIDTLLVRWPDGRAQLLTDVDTDRVLTLNYEDATSEVPALHPPDTLPSLLTEVTDQLKLNWKHQESDFVDFNYQALLHRQYSREGPGMAVGDVNGDGREDLFVGGAKGQSGVIFLQKADGSFQSRLLAQDEDHEDAGGLLFDADGDQDLDLYVASGSSEYSLDHPAYADRFYRNDGEGQFVRDTTALPHHRSSSSCVTAADYDRDGDLDLFVGGRVMPNRYPLPVSSYILRNEGGKFVDVTATVAPLLEEIGMVTTSLWTDFDDDGAVDLLIAGEWMPITFLRNESGRFVDVTPDTGLDHTAGWWTSLAAGDFDQDGDTDYLAGNQGLNSKYRASPEEPVCVYAKDYDENGSIDPILCYYIEGVEYPAHPRSQLIEQLVGMRKRYPNYASYAEASWDELFTSEELSGAYVLKSERMSSSFLENLGQGAFAIRALPDEVQVAPLQGMVVSDMNGDQRPDVLVVGNSYASETQQGWHDAGIGRVLLGTDEGAFDPLTLSESGFYVDSDAKALVELQSASGLPTWISSSNDDSLKVFQPRQTSKSELILLEPLDAYARIRYADGRSEKQEFYYGSSYLSQSGRHLRVTGDTREVTIVTFGGESRTVTGVSVARR